MNLRKILTSILLILVGTASAEVTSGFSLGANKAYLDTPVATSARGFVFDIDNPTGIESMYDVRWTRYDVRWTRYDVRWTGYDVRFERSPRRFHEARHLYHQRKEGYQVIRTQNYILFYGF